MKQLVTTIFLHIALVLISNIGYAQITKHVLFIGNSYTSVNNLPQLIANAASSAGNNFIFDSNTPGGSFLVDHLVNSGSLNKIETSNWDYVVLQDQSNSYAASTPIYFNAAYKLDSIIHKYQSCAKTMFYITWGKRDGDVYFCEPPECNPSVLINRTYFEMDSKIEQNYMLVADSLKAAATPVGATWRNLRSNYPSIELFATDGSHPTMAGSYAAACCFYTTLFNANPLQISYDATLPANDAAIIRNVVKQEVYDSLSKWNVGVFDALLDSSCSLMGIRERKKDAFFSLSANLVSEKLTINLLDDNLIESIKLYNSMGILLKEEKAQNKTQINVANLPSGLYIARIDNNLTNSLTFIKL